MLTNTQKVDTLSKLKGAVTKMEILMMSGMEILNEKGTPEHIEIFKKYADELISDLKFMLDIIPK